VSEEASQLSFSNVRADFAFLAQGLRHHSCVSGKVPGFTSECSTSEGSIMRKLLLLIPAAMISFLVGCNMSQDGGVPSTANSFKLITPAITKDIKQGTAETTEASIDRGSDFKQDVHLTVTKPDKVDVKLNKETIKASEDGKFTMTVTAEKGAPLGEQTVKITAKPEGGGAATVGEFKIKVTENK
jgi:hypothetical protein